MSTDQPTLILASGSPRRRDILQQLGLRFLVVPADIDESVQPEEAADAYVLRLATQKALTIATAYRASTNESLRDVWRPVVLAADTTVVFDGEILGKPVDADDARHMLRRLQGTDHETMTGVAVWSAGTVRADVVRTIVTFTDMDDAMIDWYINTGEPMDKAGSYAIQGIGGSFVKSITGSLQTVVGLPMVETAQLLKQCGHTLDHFRN
jgi:septum formation protein